MFPRRMYGDVFVSKLFYHVVTWIWINSDFKEHELRQHQDAVIKNVFNEDISRFVSELREDTWMQRWDNSKEGYLSDHRCQQLATKTGIFGPIAGVFGRHLELRLASNPREKYILAETIEYSIDCGDALNRVILPGNR